MSLIPLTIVAASRVSCLRPQWSNHPLQNSLHINGVSGRSSFSLRNCSSMFAPVPKFTVQSRSSSALFVKLELQSHWNKGTSVNPAFFTMSRIAETYGLSIPYEPYSFSTCTMMMFPPRVICKSASCLPTSFMKMPTRSI